MVCKSLGQLIGIAKAGAAKLNDKNCRIENLGQCGSGRAYKLTRVEIAENGRRQVTAYSVILSGAPSCQCAFFTENKKQYGDQTVCKHIIYLRAINQMIGGFATEAQCLYCERYLHEGEVEAAKATVRYQTAPGEYDTDTIHECQQCQDDRHEEWASQFHC